MSRSLPGHRSRAGTGARHRFAQNARSTTVDPHAGHVMEQAPAAAAPAQAAPVSDTLPADAPGALDALKRSSRHQEYVDVALPGATTKIKTFVVYPERKDKAPVVLVIHEIFGLSDWVRGVADQLAKEGFIAIAPDLISGMAPKGGGSEELGDQGATAGHPQPEAGGRGCAVERRA